jgi:hypothetical protein
MAACVCIGADLARAFDGYSLGTAAVLERDQERLRLAGTADLRLRILKMLPCDPRTLVGEDVVECRLRLSDVVADDVVACLDRLECIRLVDECVEVLHVIDPFP